ncbi:MAG: hypothetical protein DCF25_06340 [Leptolyngbya foveolarum]|uniref:HD/PDEase domain-containing protein n=1 Tax=Leptolyngbya foveolarum TaxID=47253 RepID=A0A2W4UMT4_9CYAN|nr:MAG: hypothetical protein DCF25_06340 [Leptolyngbya foveolarum]
MSVLRYITRRVHQIWSSSFLRLKHPGRYLKRQVSRRYALWADDVQRFLPSAHSSAADSDRSENRLERRTRRPGARVKGAVGRRLQRSRQRRQVPTTHHSVGKALISKRSPKRNQAIALLAVLLLATCFGQRFYNQPGLAVNSLSTQTFYAPKSAVVINEKETERRREEARTGTVEVLKINAEVTNAAESKLNALLAQGRELREQAGSPPFLNPQTLSKPTQEFLFQASNAQWSEVWQLALRLDLSAVQLTDSAEASTETNAETNVEADAVVKVPPPPIDVQKQIRTFVPDQIFAIKELLAYRDLSGPIGLSSLKTQMEGRRKLYQQEAAELIAELAANSGQGHPLYNAQAFDLSEDEWLVLENTTRQIFDEMMQQGVHRGAPPDLILRAIELRIPTDLPDSVRSLAADVVAYAVTPNLTPDLDRTYSLANQKAGEIEPVVLKVAKGDLIVRANQAIGQDAFLLLDHFELSDRYFNWLGLCGFSLLVAAATTFYFWIDHIQANQLQPRDHFLVLLLCLVVSLLALLKVPTVGLPAVGLLVGSFYGSALGLTVIGLLAIVLPIGTPVSTIPLITGALAAILGACIAPQLRSREEFALLGGFVGLSQATVYLLLTLIRSTVSAPLWQAVFVGSAMHGLYGIAWSVVALGVSPYLEHLFDVVTPIRLAELSNPNRPLLKRLASEAPGTFQHTMFVANLAEAAARSLGRNVELVRAGTLYHDIGKMHDPLGFIENQMGGPNKHDLIDDPWQSARIIRKHVTQGLVMARKYRLPKAVRAFIPEHQGDMKISYFYQQAKARQEKEPTLVVDEADFRYDGPTPQTPETGITMLADSCEAALRSLKPDAAIDEAYVMVNKILRARWRSGQLADSGLTRENINTVANVFIQVWQQHNHKRIAYPKEMNVEEKTVAGEVVIRSEAQA